MEQDFRKSVINQLSDYAKRTQLDDLIKSHEAPFLVLDINVIKQRYKLLQDAMPFVNFYYAIKSLNHPAVIKALSDCDGYFDVATKGEIDLIKTVGASIEHCMHTHPIKKPADIDYAYKSGIKSFVVDNKAEIKKFIGRPEDIGLLLRLSFPNPEAKSDLSFKFGASLDEAEELVKFAYQNNLKVRGFCLHVGSQIHSAQAYAHAIKSTLPLIDRLENELGIKFEVLDFGGGLPVSYRQPATPFSEIAEVVNSLLEPVKDRFTILAEPGRFICAPAMTLVCSVVGISKRHNQNWYYIDEGIYGSYSNVIYEDVHPAIIAYKELFNDQLDLEPCTLAGPTCDSVDIIAKNYDLPALQPGDLLISPMMGSYTSVTAGTFNSIPKTPIIVINQ